VCIGKSTDCPISSDPVCGCDGVTYLNLCYAEAAGISIAKSGECNTKPVADAGSDKNVITGQPVTLDGSNSFDPDQDLITFLWSFMEVPAGSGINDLSLSDPASPQPMFTPDINGTYRLKLIVNDGALDSDPDEVEIISSMPNVAPNADTGTDQNAFTGTAVYLDGSESSDPDNGPQPLSYLWSFFDMPSGSNLSDNDIADRNKAIANFVPDADGTYVLRLTVSDGDASSSDDTAVKASARNVAPNANAGADIEILLGQTAVLDGSASNDPDNGPGALSYLWSFVAVGGGSSLTNGDIVSPDTATPSFTPDAAGTYVLELKVNDGEASAYDNVSVTAKDDCPNDPNKTEPGICGCGVADTDSDNDGIADCQDACPDTPANETADENGCSARQIDNDKDGYTEIQGDCDDNNEGINPAASDNNCNGVDENCNGTSDEDYVSTQNTCGTGACQSSGQLLCQAGVIIDTCEPGAPQQEGPINSPTCSDTIDNDCDGLTDNKDSDCMSDIQLPDLTGKWTFLTSKKLETRHNIRWIVHGKLRVTNQGNKHAVSFMIKYYFVPLGDGSPKLLKKRVIKKLHAGDSANIVFNDTFMNNSSEAGYILAVIDAGNDVVESNEDNNDVLSDLF
jgi:hypothetical protein